MPLAKPLPIAELIIPLDDDDFEEEEIEVHSLQQQVRLPHTILATSLT